MDAARLLELGGLILALAVLARLASQFAIPAIPFYLLAGLAFGEGGLLPLGTTHSFVEIGSEIGLILLLFMLGLEYSARDLITTMRRSVPTALFDVVLNFTPGFLAGFLLDFGLVTSLFLGGVTLVTSSGVAAKIISDLGWSGGRGAQFVVSVCVIEDLTMALYLPILGVLVVGGATLAGFGSAALAVLGVIVVLLLAMRVQVGISRLVFSTSEEALLLTILGLALLVAGLAELIDVSAAVGALLIGIVLSGPAAQSARQLLAPLRDLFSAFFFAFIGLQVDPASLPPVLGAAALLGFVGIASKALTGWLATRNSGMERRERVRAATGLVARGEFSLAIAGLGVTSGLTVKLASVTVAYVLLLVVIGPILARVSDVVMRRNEALTSED
ncbi:MAG: cation:proton antiporter [Actinomycetota bacterium]